MANDRDRVGKIGGMTTRQKAIIGALIVIVLIIIWQVMGLFGSEKPASPPAANQALTPNPAAGSSAPGPQTTAPQFPGEAPGPRPVEAPQATREPVLHQIPVTLESKLLESQKSSEEKYIDHLNQLQLLKVQREIAEMNQAIAAARLATVTAEKNVSDLLTKPSQPIAPPETPIPPGAYSGALVNPATQGIQVVEQMQQPPPPPVPTEIPYVVISVSMQLGKWNAVIGYQGKLYNVNIGDVLPEDDSIVSAISRNGVTLMDKKGKRRKVSILTSI